MLKEEYEKYIIRCVEDSKTPIGGLESFCTLNRSSYYLHFICYYCQSYLGDV